jgi:hypothetical protein
VPRGARRAAHGVLVQSKMEAGYRFVTRSNDREQRCFFFSIPGIANVLPCGHLRQQKRGTGSASAVRPSERPRFQFTVNQDGAKLAAGGDRRYRQRDETSMRRVARNVSARIGRRSFPGAVVSGTSVAFRRSIPSTRTTFEEAWQA